MATIKLTNIRTGVSYNYPLAYLDLSDTTGLNFQEGQQFGAHLSANCAEIDPEWESRPEAEKKIYKLNTNGLSPTLYLTDYIDPTSSDNLIHESSSTTIASLFTPTLLNEGVTWEEKPEDYDIYGKYYNPTGYVLGGVHLTCGGGAWQTSPNPRDPGPSLDRKWYESTRANQLYKTAVNTYFAVAMGLSSYQEEGRYTVGVVANCAQQWNSAASPEANAFPINNRSPYGQLQCVAGDIAALDSGYTRIGAYQAYKASHTVDELDEEVVPCSKIATQMVYTKIDNVGYVGCAVTLFEPATLGLRPVNTQVTLYPSWLFGGLEGEFLPPGEVEHVDDIPVPAAQVKNGSWSISENVAGIPSVPGSPLSGIGMYDAGLHVAVVDATAINRIENTAWNANSVNELSKLCSGIINVGFMPYAFIKKFRTIGNGMEHICVGAHPVTVPYSSSDLTGQHAWHCNSEVFTRPIFQQGQEHFHTFEVPLVGKYGNYLDYDPYTSVELEVPFCGKLSIPASSCIGGKIHIDFQVNLTNGDVCAIITTETDKDGLITDGMAQGTPKKLHKTFYLNGNCMCPFPIIGTSTGQVQQMQTRMQALSGAGMALGLLAVGNPMGAVGQAGAISGLMNTPMKSEMPFTGGSPIGSPALIGNKKIVLTISVPSPQYGDRYIGANPFGCYQEAKLSEVHDSTNTQYNVNNLSLVTVGDIEFGSESGMTQVESMRIKELLKGGVYV